MVSGSSVSRGSLQDDRPHGPRAHSTDGRRFLRGSTGHPTTASRRRSANRGDAADDGIQPTEGVDCQVLTSDERCVVIATRPKATRTNLGEPLMMQDLDADCPIRMPVMSNESSGHVSTTTLALDMFTICTDRIHANTAIFVSETAFYLLEKILQDFPCIPNDTRYDPTVQRSTCELIAGAARE